MTKNLQGLLNIGNPNLGTYTPVDPISINEQRQIGLKHDKTLGVNNYGQLTIKEAVKKIIPGKNITVTPESGTGEVKIDADASGWVTSVSQGAGISVDRTTGAVTVSAQLYLRYASSGTVSNMTTVSGVYYGYVAGFTKFSTGMDIIEVTSASDGLWGPLSYNVYTPGASTSVYVYGHRGLGIPDDNIPVGSGTCRVYFANIPTNVNINGLAFKYEMQERQKELLRFNSNHSIGQQIGFNDMYIPNKPDIVVGVGDTVDLKQYIKNIYFTSHNDYNWDKNEYNDLFKVSLDDCLIEGLDTSKAGIKKIDIKYIGEHNTYDDKTVIVPETIYMEVRA